MRSFVIYIESYFSVSLIVLHSPKMRGGGGELSSLCKKMGGEMSTPYYIAGGEMP